MKRTNTGEEKKKLNRSDSDLSDDEIGEYFSSLIGKGDSDEEFELTEQQEMEFLMTTQGRFNAGLDKIKLVKAKKTKSSDSSEDVKITKQEKEEWEKTIKEMGEPDEEYEERELKEWGEKGFQGTVGENYARKAFESKGLKTIDLNELALNFGGLDNISNDPKYPFEQTKLHLAETTATVSTYEAHLEKAGTYAITAIRFLKKHEKKLTTLIETNKDFKDHVLLKQMLTQLKDLEGTEEDDIDGTEVHDTVAKGMLFSVPSDIYDKIDAKIKDRFISLGKTVKELNEFKVYMKDDFTPTPVKKTDDEKDGDFTEC
jgi:hypothetical protein